MAEGSLEESRARAGVEAREALAHPGDGAAARPKLTLDRSSLDRGRAYVSGEQELCGSAESRFHTLRLREPRLHRPPNVREQIAVLCSLRWLIFRNSMRTLRGRLGLSFHDFHRLAV